MSLLIRRGLEKDRMGITFAVGEMIYITDTKKVYIGDGRTAGGILLGGGIPFIAPPPTTTAAPVPPPGPPPPGGLPPTPPPAPAGALGNVVIGPGGGGKVAVDPDWNYAGHTFFENSRHDYQYFAIEYAGMDLYPKTGVAALPRETQRELLRDYAIKVLGWDSDSIIPTGPDGEVSFTDPNFKPQVKLQDYMLTTATEKGYLDSQGKSTLPLDAQQQIDQAQLASMNDAIQAQLERIRTGQQTMANTGIPPIADIAAAAAAAVAASANNPLRNDPNLIGGPLPPVAPPETTPEPPYMVPFDGGG